MKMMPTFPISFSDKEFHFSSPVLSTYSRMHLLIKVFLPMSTTLCSRRPCRGIATNGQLVKELILGCCKNKLASKAVAVA